MRRSVSGEHHSVVETDYLITSGTLLHSDVLKKVGFFNEDFFIDYVDVEWGLRAAKRGFNCYGICKAALYHQLGEQRVVAINSRRTPPAYHQPFRYYYITRNPFLLARNPDIPFFPKLFFIFLSLYRPLDLWVTGIPNRGKCIHYSIKGGIEGILGRKGKK